MSYCLNPHCQAPQNHETARFCANCGQGLILGDRYRPGKPLGRGGFGRTFLAKDQHKPSQPICVIKQFLPKDGNVGDPEAARRMFEREAIQLEQLGRHAQIPELLAHFEANQYQYLVQQYIAGPNLSQAASKRGCFSETEIWQLLLDILPVLEFVHHHEVIHRDIKPQNIIRRKSDQQYFLVDFGAAKTVTSTNRVRTATSIGSPEFISPEQAMGKPVFASDLYSLGVTCIYLLTLIRPAELFDINEGGWAWRRSLPHPISPELGRILDKLLKGPTKYRYTTAAAVLSDIATMRSLAELGVGSATAASLPIDYQSLTFETGPTRNHLSTQTIAQTSRNSAMPSDSSVMRAMPPMPPMPPMPMPQVTIQPAVLGSSRPLSSPGAGLPDSQRPSQPALAHTQSARLQRPVTAQIKSAQMESAQMESAQMESAQMEIEGHTSRTGTREAQISGFATQGLTAQGLTARSTGSRPMAIHPAKRAGIDSGRFGQQTHWAEPDRRNSRWTDSNNRSGAATKQVDLEADAWSDSLQDACSLRHSSQLSPTWELWQTLRAHRNWVRSVVMHPNGRLMVSGSGDKTLKFWRVPSGEVIRSVDAHESWIRAVATAPGGDLLASCSNDRLVKLWNWRTGELVQTLEGHGDWVRGLAFSPDGQVLASCSQDKHIRLWCTQTWECLRVMPDHGHWVTAVNFVRTQAGEDPLLVSGSRDNTVRVWNWQTGQLLQTLTGHTACINAIAISAEHSLIASASDDNTVRLWDLYTGELLRMLTGHRGGVTSLALDERSNLLVSSGQDKRLMFWDFVSGSLRFQMDGSKSGIWSVAMHPKGDAIATGNWDGTLNLWKRQSLAALV
jgi:serine/threonine protein kinase